jgi:hypothetical protein
MHTVLVSVSQRTHCETDMVMEAECCSLLFVASKAKASIIPLS